MINYEKNYLRDMKCNSRQTGDEPSISLTNGNPVDQFLNSITNVDIPETLHCNILPLFNSSGKKKIITHHKISEIQPNNSLRID